MEADDRQVNELLKDRVQYRVPLFQRPYSWKKDTLETLWTDLTLLIQARFDEAEASHFLGPMVFDPRPTGPGQPPIFVVVDGQQRLTTIMVLLAVIRDLAKSHDLSDIAASIDPAYFRNESTGQEASLKLLPTQADRADFAAILASRFSPGPKHLLRAAYEFFAGKIQTQLMKHETLNVEPENSRQVLTTLLDAVLKGVSAIAITLGSADNAYRVFEGLNAKGVPLTQLDLLRNYIFMRLPENTGEAVYNKTWLPMQQALGDARKAMEFTHDYYTKDGQFVRMPDLYQATKKKLEAIDESHVVKWVDDMSWFSSRWLCTDDPSREGNPAVREALARLREFGSETVWPFVLNLYEARDRDNILSSEAMALILRLVESFLVRRTFRDIATANLNRIFLGLWNRVDHTVADKASAVRQVLSDPVFRWPRNSEFKASVMTYPLFVDSRPNQRLFILKAIETAYKHKEHVTFENLQIEHIMPQTLTQPWIEMLGRSTQDPFTSANDVWKRFLHTLPNLTLTGYNQNIGNSAWQVKRNYYADSHLEMTKRLAKFDEWTEVSMLTRGEELANLAVETWPGPIDG